MRKRRSTPAAAAKRKADVAWGRLIHARDRHCQHCGRSDGKLDAHHIMIRSFTATRVDDTNGVLLCFKCHQLMHSDAMAAFNFYTRLLGVEGYAALRQKAYDGAGKKYPASFWEDAREHLEKLLGELG